MQIENYVLYSDINQNMSINNILFQFLVMLSIITSLTTNDCIFIWEQLRWCICMA